MSEKSIVRPVEIHDLDQGQWQALFEMRKALHLRYYAKFKSLIMEMDLEQFRTNSLRSVETLDGREFIFFSDEEKTVPFGWMRYFSGNEDLGFQQDALEEQIPEPMLKEVARLLLEELAVKPFRHVITGSQQPRGVAAIRSMGPYSESPLLVMHLLPENVNMDKIEEWAGMERAWEGKLRFELVRDRPESQLEAYVNLQNQLLRDMPMEGGPVESNSWNSEGLRRLNLFNSENNQSAYSIIVYDMDGNMVGTTDINIRRRPLKIQQGMTGLLPPYRGKGLAKILKALMLKQIIAEFPDFERIVTTTSRLNLAMQHINEEVGFTTQTEMYEFVLKREDLEKFVGNQETTPSGGHPG